MCQGILSGREGDSEPSGPQSLFFPACGKEGGGESQGWWQCPQDPEGSKE